MILGEIFFSTCQMLVYMNRATAVWHLVAVTRTAAEKKEVENNLESVSIVENGCEREWRMGSVCWP